MYIRDFQQSPTFWSKSGLVALPRSVHALRTNLLQPRPINSSLVHCNSEIHMDHARHETTFLRLSNATKRVRHTRHDPADSSTRFRRPSIRQHVRTLSSHTHCPHVPGSTFCPHPL